MANADRNDLRKSRIESDRNQRDEQPVQPGATGRDRDEALSEKESRVEATKTYGKTEKNDSGQSEPRGKR